MKKYLIISKREIIIFSAFSISSLFVAIILNIISEKNNHGIEIIRLFFNMFSTGAIVALSMSFFPDKSYFDLNIDFLLILPLKTKKAIFFVITKSLLIITVSCFSSIMLFSILHPIQLHDKAFVQFIITILFALTDGLIAIQPLLLYSQIRLNKRNHINLILFLFTFVIFQFVSVVPYNIETLIIYRTHKLLMVILANIVYSVIIFFISFIVSYKLIKKR